MAVPLRAKAPYPCAERRRGGGRTGERMQPDEARAWQPVAGLSALLAIALAASAIAAGAFAAFLASPIVLALANEGLRLRPPLRPEAPRRAVGLGLGGSVFGVALAIVGPTPGGLLTVAAGLALAGAGAGLSWRSDPPPAAVLAGARLPRALPLGLRVGIAADLALQAAWEAAAWRKPVRGAARAAETARAAIARDRERGVDVRPARAHPLPPPLEKPRIVSRHVIGAGPLEHLSFASEYEPPDPEIRDVYLGIPANRVAHAYLWRHRDGPRPTLLCLHGYGMGRVALDARAWNVPWLHEKLGVDVALLVLPLHGPRARGRRSGAGFLDGDPLWTRAAFGQAVWDVRRIAGWLRSAGAPTLGVQGLSLGGGIAAVYASLDAELACAVPIVPAVDLAELVWRQIPSSRRAGARAAGFTRELLAEAWAACGPLTTQPRVAPNARLILAALGDRIVPPSQAHALYEHWDRSAIHWFPGSHLLFRDRPELRRRTERHFRETLLAERPPAPPPLSRFRS